MNVNTLDVILCHCDVCSKKEKLLYKFDVNNDNSMFL